MKGGSRDHWWSSQKAACNTESEKGGLEQDNYNSPYMKELSEFFQIVTPSDTQLATLKVASQAEFYEFL